MRLCGQFTRSHGADRWAREEQAERERALVDVSAAKAKVAAERARVVLREADEREERDRAARAERRQTRTLDSIARAAGVPHA
jgi:hypothetical protein